MAIQNIAASFERILKDRNVVFNIPQVGTIILGQQFTSCLANLLANCKRQMIVIHDRSHPDNFALKDKSGVYLVINNKANRVVGIKYYNIKYMVPEHQLFEVNKKAYVTNFVCEGHRIVITDDNTIVLKKAADVARYDIEPTKGVSGLTKSVAEDISDYIHRIENKTEFTDEVLPSLEQPSNRDNVIKLNKLKSENSELQKSLVKSHEVYKEIRLQEKVVVQAKANMQQWQSDVDRAYKDYEFYATDDVMRRCLAAGSVYKNDKGFYRMKSGASSTSEAPVTYALQQAAVYEQKYWSVYNSKAEHERNLQKETNTLNLIRDLYNKIGSAAEIEKKIKDNESQISKLLSGIKETL